MSLPLLGFTAANADDLEAAIRSLSASVPATTAAVNEYGEFYHVHGGLSGQNGVTLSVTTIWLKRKTDGKFWFITLIPAQKGRAREL